MTPEHAEARSSLSATLRSAVLPIRHPYRLRRHPPVVDACAVDGALRRRAAVRARVAHVRRRRPLRTDLRSSGRAPVEAGATLAGLACRDWRTLRLSRPLFRRASPRSARRCEPHRLSLAALDRAPVRRSARRAPPRAIFWGRRSDSPAQRRCSCQRAPISPPPAGRRGSAMRSRSAAPSSGRAIRCCRAA